MMAVIYDAGALVAADRNERRMWAEHRVRLEMGVSPTVPAPVVAQVSRSPRQAQLRRLLAGCEVVAFDAQQAHAVGRLLAAAKTKDIVDATVVVLAIERRANVVTSDPKDLSKLAAAARAKLPLLNI
jgi:predicted nucleic acid-binding protein